MHFHPAIFSAVILISALHSADSFVATIGARENEFFRPLSSLTAADSELDLGMTPELKRVTDAFAAINQEQVRYKQLLYMAQTTEEANSLPESSKIPENKVPGCLSTVYVDGTTVYDDKIGDYVINFLGDSDGLMTKGLVALLVRCLSGNTAESIQKVNPEFIKIARIDQSLTPGRNNGFLNMLRTMKIKAVELDKAARSEKTPSSTSMDDDERASDAPDDEAAVDGEADGQKYTAITEALQALKPESLTVIDSSQTNGSAEGEETHFELSIVASAFEGLNVIKRQQLVFMILGDLMQQVETVNIASIFTPEEAEQRA